MFLSATPVEGMVAVLTLMLVTKLRRNATVERHSTLAS
jgi:hypothetical protein